MINKILKIFFLITLIFFFNSLKANENFEFNVTELKIIEKGNIIQGFNRGEILTNNLLIEANQFIYEKKINKLILIGNVVVKDIFNDDLIFSDKVIYFKNEEKIYSEGKTRAILSKNYNLNAQDIFFFLKEDIIKSKKPAKIIDKNSNEYSFENYIFHTKNEILKAENILISLNDKKINISEENLKFTSGFFDLKNKNFNGKDIKIDFKKNIFNNNDNDPRIAGVSSYKKDHITVINKAIFTSCKKNDKCPPWSIEADKIKHDKNKKQLIYQNAIINVYDFPVLYFPKFFHPDPTVTRQAGFLQPEFNNSQILSSSLKIPYFYPISDNKDLTLKPTLFDNKVYTLQNEFRQKNKNSYLETDFGVTKGYKSIISNNQNSLTHLFAKFTKDLNLENFTKSEIKINLEKTSNDTYLKIFDQVISDTKLKPLNSDKLISNFDIIVDNENYSFTSGFSVSEDLQKQQNDRYQYILPYYNYSSSINLTNNGSYNFNSSGSNNLIDTNNLKSLIVNDLSYSTNDFIFDNGIKNNLSIDLKNVNTYGKKDNIYKSSPQIELMSLIQMKSTLPMIKKTKNYSNLLEPKVSLRYNPTNMKNYSTEERFLNINNIFEINRLGLSDSLESGKSVTLGFDFKKESLKDINNYFEFKLARVLRDKFENNIPTKSLINNKESSYFGMTKYSINENINLEYNYIINKNLNDLEYNSIRTEFYHSNFSTIFNFIEEDSIISGRSILENQTEYKYNENNSIKYKTRVNKEINLTEYHDLVYEYKNDCLTAGISFKKTYYEDRDLKPSEDIFFSITLYPLTTFEQKIN